MKGFENTKFASVLKKVKEVAVDNGADIGGIAIKAATGNIGGALKDTIGLLSGIDTPEAKGVLNDLKIQQMEIERDFYKIEAQDTQNARDNETARDISENAGFLSKNIHEIIAIAVIGSWIVTWFIKLEFNSQDILGAVMLILGYLYGRSKPQS